MWQIKPISPDSIPEALDKAIRYRLLNDPRLAESICLDILEIDPENQEAIVTLLLSKTDQFGVSASADVADARQLLPRLHSPYDQYYYGGIICERQAKAVLTKDLTGSPYMAYEWLMDAMELFEQAEALRPPNKDDSILHWNTCVRMIMSNHLHPRQEEFVEPPLE